MPRKAKPLPAKVKAALAGEIAEPQLAELVSSFVACAGGVQGLAKMLFDTYRHPAATPMVKHRIIDTILRGMKFANDRAGPRNDLGLASDDDLVREAEDILRGMGDAPQDGPPEPEPGGPGGPDAPAAAPA